MRRSSLVTAQRRRSPGRSLPSLPISVRSLNRRSVQRVRRWGSSVFSCPGILVLLGTLPWWTELRRRARAQAAMRGVNAAVVGLLGAALYNPVWVTSVRAPADFAIALVGFALLQVWRAPPLIVVILSACGGIVLSVTSQ